MIFGDCPFCEHPQDFAIGAAKLPLFKKVVCENCGQVYYEYLSRVKPRAYKPDELIIDEKNHSIKIKEES